MFSLSFSIICFCVSSCPCPCPCPSPPPPPPPSSTSSSSATTSSTCSYSSLSLNNVLPLLRRRRCGLRILTRRENVNGCRAFHCNFLKTLAAAAAGCPKQMYSCDGTNRCLLLSSLCDTVKDCEDGSDERNCPLDAPGMCRVFFISYSL